MDQKEEKPVVEKTIAKKKTYTSIRKCGLDWKYCFALLNGLPVCLLCKTQLSRCKRYNFSRHFNIFHGKSEYAMLDDEQKKERWIVLEAQLPKPAYIIHNESPCLPNQDSMKKVAVASYAITYEIMMNNQSPSDGSFIKKCTIAMCESLFPELVPVVKSVPLTEKVITKKADHIFTNINAQLIQKVKTFEHFSFAIKENTDIFNTTQILMMIRGIDSRFNITEEIISYEILNHATSTLDVFHSFKKCVDRYKLDLKKIYSITTHESPNMRGFQDIFSQEYPNETVTYINCIVDEDCLSEAVSVMDMSHIVDVIVDLIDFLRNCSTKYESLFEFSNENFDILSDSKIKLMDAAKAFTRIWDLRMDIIAFFGVNKKIKAFELFINNEWLMDFAFFTDVLEYVQELNEKLKTKNIVIMGTWDYVKAFKAKILLFVIQLGNGKFDHFPRLQTLPGAEVMITTYSEKLVKMHNEFNRRFDDLKKLECDMNIVVSPFEAQLINVDPELWMELVGLQSNLDFKKAFVTFADRLESYQNMDTNSCPKLIEFTKKIMTIFGSLYTCEKAFACMKVHKNSLSKMSDSRLTSLVRVSNSQLKPDFKKLAATHLVE